MTAQPIGLCAFDTAEADSKAQHHLLELDVRQLARRLVIFTPTGSAVDSLVAMAKHDIAGIADATLVHRVIKHNPDSLWGIARRDRYDSTSPRAEGFVGFLMLNADGMRRLTDGTLDRRAPDLSLLARQNGAPGRHLHMGRLRAGRAGRRHSPDTRKDIRPALCGRRPFRMGLYLRWQALCRVARLSSRHAARRIIRPEAASFRQSRRA